jgi:HK97 family phage portal protein
MAKLQRYHLVEERPSRVQRFVESMRSYWLGPWSTSAKDIGPYWGGGSVSAGVSVNASTALNYSAVWNAVSLISSQVGNLPCVFYRKTGQNKDRYNAHPLYRLVHDRPNPELSAFTFREMLQAHVLLWGNAYAEIERNDADRPIALWPITPDRVTPFRRSADALLEYRVQEPSNQEKFFTARQILHVPGLGFD